MSNSINGNHAMRLVKKDKNLDAYDRLPRVIRSALQDSPFDVSARRIASNYAKCRKGGMTADQFAALVRGNFAGITQSNARAAYGYAHPQAVAS